ncbi:MAG: hypothetical protein B7Z39_02945 [Novosphingobium sp. 12-64-8]|nr:MAG: hypothetical protein B7Z39_02945 [Novosphingobium sp. 12-64-8]
MDMTPIRSTGASADRIDVVIVAEGYTAGERDKFLADAATFTTYMLSAGNAALNDPFATYSALFNASAVFVASNQSGYSTDTTTVDTAFNAHAYLSDGRLVYGDTNLVYDALSPLAGNARDLVIVLINSDKYGGAGGAVAWATAGNPFSYEVALHEIGHSFAGLQDEYVDSNIGSGPLPTSLDSVHVSLSSDPADVPWQEWLGFTDSLGTVGVFEGGFYRSTGIWRATENSKMLSLGVAFSAPEKEAFVNQFYLSTDNLVDVAPQRMLVQANVTTPDDGLFDFGWTIDGAAAGGDSSTLGLRDAIAARADGDLTLAVKVTVTDGTGLVRKASVIAASTESESFDVTVRKTTLSPDSTTFKASAAANHFVVGTGLADRITLKGASTNLCWVESGGGNDKITGSASGDACDAGTGNDTIAGVGGDDFLFAGAGNDRIDGGIGNDALDGGDGKDILIGGAGNDTLRGGAGIDTVTYESASAAVSVDLSLARGNARSVKGDAAGIGVDLIEETETVIGSRYGDRITGDGEANRLEGAGGNDRLAGGGGVDLLIGGAGRDTVAGGAGNDRFVFAEGDFGGSTMTTADIITDWAKGDRIDLRGVDADFRAAAAAAGDQAFAFLGTAAFNTGDSAIGELRYETSGKTTWIMGDQNGDGLADFLIRLDGAHTLIAADFML